MNALCERPLRSVQVRGINRLMNALLSRDVVQSLHPTGDAGEQPGTARAAQHRDASHPRRRPLQQLMTATGNLSCFFHVI